MISTITTRRDEDAQLAASAKIITKATAKFGRAFVEMINTVGPELELAHQLHAKRGSGSWGYWCEQTLDISKRQADKLRSAYAIMLRLSSAQVSRLPSSETQCRELGRVDEAKQVEAWNTVVEADCDSTAATVRDALMESSFLTGSRKQQKPADSFVSVVQAALAKLPAKDRKAILGKPLQVILAEE